jgi:hypothetical protein
MAHTPGHEPDTLKELKRRYPELSESTLKQMLAQGLQVEFDAVMPENVPGQYYPQTNTLKLAEGAGLGVVSHELFHAGNTLLPVLFSDSDLPGSPGYTSSALQTVQGAGRFDPVDLAKLLADPEGITKQTQADEAFAHRLAGDTQTISELYNQPFRQDTYGILFESGLVPTFSTEGQLTSAAVQGQGTPQDVERALQYSLADPILPPSLPAEKQSFQRNRKEPSGAQTRADERRSRGQSLREKLRVPAPSSPGRGSGPIII